MIPSMTSYFWINTTHHSCSVIDPVGPRRPIDHPFTQVLCYSNFSLTPYTLRTILQRLIDLQTCSFGCAWKPEHLVENLKGGKWKLHTVRTGGQDHTWVCATVLHGLHCSTGLHSCLFFPWEWSPLIAQFRGVCVRGTPPLCWHPKWNITPKNYSLN